MSFKNFPRQSFWWMFILVCELFQSLAFFCFGTFIVVKKIFWPPKTKTPPKSEVSELSCKMFFQRSLSISSIFRLKKQIFVSFLFCSRLWWKIILVNEIFRCLRRENIILVDVHFGVRRLYQNRDEISLKWFSSIRRST